MDSVLFSLGGWDISQQSALFGGVILAALAGLGLILRAMGRGAEDARRAAREATEELRGNFQSQIAERDARMREMEAQILKERERLNDQLEAERGKSSDLYAELSALRARLAEQVKQSEANLARFVDARQQMTDEFKAIAGDVLKSHGETFSKQNREQVDVLLKPLQEKIGEFHSGLLKDRAAMSEQIRALAESNLQITTEAQNLTRALKSNAQTQGAWGEMILATILERSGLREGEQYITQTSHSGDNGARLRTDVEVLMPNDDRLVIDSKVSLTAFEAYTNAEDDMREQHLQAHVLSVRTHIKTLGEKAYHRHAQSSLDYVMMFVPIESALAAAIQADGKLVDYGMSQGVMLTTPTTLMTVLRTVRNVWDIEKRHRNADEIAERAGALYEKVAGFLSSMDRLDGHLDKARQSFEDAKGQLSSGRGNVVRQVEMLRELGAKTNRSLPSGWDGGEEETPSLRLVEPGDLS
ncbi:DNA recombination protein RmuC [Devosia sp.]|uniref:DNA recombination protein RmuC n=1 Tax=Devosia sp. TaxID=1871048 RepID=UPI002AFE7D2E|nr:DNA recombination protein RmuC [Devosia sp.]